MDDQLAGSASTATPTAPAYEPLKLSYHVIVGVAMGLVAAFTFFAWPFAILTGMIIGRADVERMLGQPRRGTAVRVLAVTGGVLAMLIFGAVLGGFIAFLVAAGASYSERLAARASPTDRTMARIVISVATVLVWLLLVVILQVDVGIDFDPRTFAP